MLNVTANNYKEFLGKIYKSPAGEFGVVTGYDFFKNTLFLTDFTAFNGLALAKRCYSCYDVAGRLRDDLQEVSLNEVVLKYENNINELAELWLIYLAMGKKCEEFSKPELNYVCNFEIEFKKHLIHRIGEVTHQLNYLKKLQENKDNRYFDFDELNKQIAIYTKAYKRLYKRVYFFAEKNKENADKFIKFVSDTYSIYDNNENIGSLFQSIFIQRKQLERKKESFLHGYHKLLENIKNIE